MNEVERLPLSKSRSFTSFGIERSEFLPPTHQSLNAQKHENEIQSCRQIHFFVEIDSNRKHIHRDPQIPMLKFLSHHQELSNDAHPAGRGIKIGKSGICKFRKEKTDEKYTRKHSEQNKNPLLHSEERDFQLTSVFTAMQPEVPSLNTRPEEEELQAHVCIEFDLEEKNSERADADDTCRPRPDVLLDAEVDREESEDYACEFEQAHATTVERWRRRRVSSRLPTAQRRP